MKSVLNAYDLYSDFQLAYDLVSKGLFDDAKHLTRKILEALEQEDVKTDNYYLMLSNVAGLLIDIGHLSRNKESSERGLKLLLDNQVDILKVVPHQNYYYNLGNAQGNMVSVESPFQHTFLSIQKLVEAKQCFWKAIKSAEVTGEIPPELLTNLATNLKQQFRIVEALDWYETVQNADIAQAYINRADTLKLLNVVSNTYTLKLIFEVAKSYEDALASGGIPSHLLPHFESQASLAREVCAQVASEHGLDSADDHHANQLEYANQSAYRKFCLDKHLALSEHSLYCPCIASARDNLTIPTVSGIQGEFVIEMEAVLNRLKSEFSFARRLYFEYLYQQADEELLHESCFSELLNNELLGIHVEKLRTSFRFCFGILDKIAEAICDLHDLRPQGNIYFHNFWQLNNPERMQKFEAVKSPGLLALYSIATDLNGNCDTAEWGFFKDWRNALEHRALIIQPEYAMDLLGSYKSHNIVLVKEALFINRLELMLGLTRSAIFSFVFAVRERAQIKNGQQSQTAFHIQRQNFE